MKTNYPTKKLGEVIEINYGKGLSKNGRIDSGKYFAYGSNGPVYRTNESLTKGEIIVIGRKGTAGALYFISEPCWPIDTTFFAKPKNGVSLKFIYYLLQIKRLPRLAIVTGVPGINRTTLANINIQLPPPQTQKQIVERLDKIVEAQKLNDDLIQKSDELFQSLLHKELNPAQQHSNILQNVGMSDKQKWEVKELGNVCDVRDGTHTSPKFFPEGLPLITSKNLIGGVIDFSNIQFISEKDYLEIEKRSKVDYGEILFGMIGTIGNPVVVRKNRKFSIKNVGLIKFTAASPINIFVYYILLSSFVEQQIKKFSRGGTQKFISLGNLRNLKVPLPDLKIQKQIVAKLSAVQDYKKQLFEQKVKLKELFESVLHKSMQE